MSNNKEVSRHSGDKGTVSVTKESNGVSDRIITGANNTFRTSDGKAFLSQSEADDHARKKSGN